MPPTMREFRAAAESAGGGGPWAAAERHEAHQPLSIRLESDQQYHCPAERPPADALSDSATGYGLLYVYPIDGHDVVVSSGTQWWTPFPVNVPVFGPGGRGGGRGAGPAGGRQRERPVFTTYTPFGGRPANSLYGLGDWVLYRGSLQNVVAQGRFDENGSLIRPMSRS